MSEAKTKKTKKTSKKGKRTSNKIKLFKMKDKSDHEKWTKGRNIWNIPSPFRMLMMGSPNVGKSTLVLNILARMKPHPKRVTVVHCDPEYTEDYHLVDCEMLSEIPPIEYFDECEGKQVLIVDDLGLKKMPKSQLALLDRMFGYVSTHRNVNCILTSQDPFSVPPCVRRNCNVFVFWKSRDLDALSMLARRLNFSADEFREIFDKFTDKRDCLVLDDSSGTPYPVRKNFFLPMNVKETE